MKINILVFNKHIQEGRFLLAVQQGRWGIIDDIDERPTWPFIIFWIQAGKREGSPEKYFFRFELDNYPSAAPNICIWNNEKGIPLEAGNRPVGVEDVKILFRTDWEGGIHLYAPYERKALATHPDWPSQYPNMYWKSTDSVMKALENIYQTLNSPDYHGK